MRVIAVRAAARASLLALASFGLVGCLDFDEQEIRVRIDPQKDRLDALLVYRGLYNNALIPPNAEKLLDSLQRGERVFSVVEPALFFDLDTSPVLKEPRWASIAGVKLENGRAFRDKEGRLCAWQFLRVEKLSAVLDAVNAAYREWLATPEGTKKFLRTVSSSDGESVELLRRAIADKHAFFALRGKALAFRIPMSAEGQKVVLKRIAEDWVRKAADPNARRSLDREIELFASSELSWIRAGDVSECVIGNPERAELRVHVPRRDKYSDNLVDLLAEKKVRVHDDVTDESILKEFEAFCAR